MKRNETAGGRAALAFALRHRLSLWGERLRQVRRLPPDALEIALATLNLLIGMRLLWPNHLTYTGRATPALIHVMPLNLWPLVLLPCGVLTWVGYLDNVTPARRLSAGVLWAFWAVTAAVLMVRLWGSFGPLYNLAFCCCEGWLYFALGVYEVRAKYAALRSARSLPASPTALDPALVPPAA